MNFYLDTISLEQSNCKLANFVYNGLFNTFQHCSALFQQLRSAQKQVKELNKIELSVNAKTFQPQQNAEAVVVVYMIGEMEE